MKQSALRLLKVKINNNNAPDVDILRYVLNAGTSNDVWVIEVTYM
jgi:hypothetical protein